MSSSHLKRGHFSWVAGFHRRVLFFKPNYLVGGFLLEKLHCISHGMLCSFWIFQILWSFMEIPHYHEIDFKADYTCRMIEERLKTLKAFWVIFTWPESDSPLSMSIFSLLQSVFDSSLSCMLEWNPPSHAVLTSRYEIGPKIFNMHRPMYICPVFGSLYLSLHMHQKMSFSHCFR